MMDLPGGAHFSNVSKEKQKVLLTTVQEGCSEMTGGEIREV